MLVRRIATVTISAPLASVARRVSSRSLYLPVPTSRRERKARPAMISGSWWSVIAAPASCWGMERMQGRPTSATPDRMNNFDLVASRKLVLSVAAARHDDLIDFQRNAPPGQLELLE